MPTIKTAPERIPPERIVKGNPHVDPSQLAETLAVLRELDALGPIGSDFHLTLPFTRKVSGAGELKQRRRR